MNLKINSGINFDYVDSASYGEDYLDVYNFRMLDPLTQEREKLKEEFIRIKEALIRNEANN